MMDKIPYSSDMIVNFFGKRKCFSDKTGNPLSYCAVEALDIICFTAFFSYLAMTLRRKNSFIGRPEIGITYGTLPVNTGH